MENKNEISSSNSDDDDKKFIILEGIIKRVLFENNENDYRIFSILSEIIPEEIQKYFDENIICVGYVLGNIGLNDYVKIKGKLINHYKYGYQISIEMIEKTLPKNSTSLEKYLKSGILPGVGEVIAKRIIEKFKDDTLLVLETDPERLSSVKGLSLKKAKKINEKFIDQKELRDIMIKLHGYGLSMAYATRVYKYYKEYTISVIQNSPYRLCNEVQGIGFKMSDEIAINIGVEKDDMNRIKAGIKYILSYEASNSGSVFLPKDLLINQTANLLDLDILLIEHGITKLHADREIIVEKINNNSDSDSEELIIFLSYYYYAESYVAKKLLDLSYNTVLYTKKTSILLDIIQEKINIELAQEQVLAIKEAMTRGALVITGGPGTGKTTTINIIIDMLKREGYEVELCAPTGRAAKRMSEVTGLEAKTIHRLLEVKFLSSKVSSDDESYDTNNVSRQIFERNEDFPIEADVIIVDECSMIDISLMCNFLRAVASGTRLIMVGDVDQLPSVGAGKVLRDIINSKCIETVKLQHIFRQAQESAIIMNAHRINNGIYPILNEKLSDFFFLGETQPFEVNKLIVELVTKRLPKYLNIDDIFQIQVLCPMRKTEIGVNNLNDMLQEAINPSAPYKQEKAFFNMVFREGDKVMQIKNNYSAEWKIYKNNIPKESFLVSKGTGIFNGDEGVIQKINIQNEKIEVLFDENKIVIYNFNNLEDLKLAYAITIHKSQGSEYKVVVIPIHSGSPMFFTRNLLYTAVTRARELVVIVGIKDTLYQMVDNNSEVNRYTYLKNRIIELSKLDF